MIIESQSISNISLGASILKGFLITIVLLTVWYYFRTIMVLRQYPIEFQQAVRPAIRKLNFYAFVQLITLVPYLIDRNILIQEGAANVDVDAFSVLSNLSGLANALIYLFSSQNYNKLDEKDSKRASLRPDEE